MRYLRFVLSRNQCKLPYGNFHTLPKAVSYFPQEVSIRLWLLHHRPYLRQNCFLQLGSYRQLPLNNKDYLILLKNTNAVLHIFLENDQFPMSRQIFDLQKRHFLPVLVMISFIPVTKTAVLISALLSICLTSSRGMMPSRSKSVLYACKGWEVK